MFTYRWDGSNHFVWDVFTFRVKGVESRENWRERVGERIKGYVENITIGWILRSYFSPGAPGRMKGQFSTEIRQWEELQKTWKEKFTSSIIHIFYSFSFLFRFFSFFFLFLPSSLKITGYFFRKANHLPFFSDISSASSLNIYFLL